VVPVASTEFYVNGIADVVEEIRRKKKVFLDLWSQHSWLKVAAEDKYGYNYSNRTRGNGHKMKQSKFHLNMRKNFFTLWVTEPWPRMPREVVESPSLEIFKTLLDVVLCSLLWVTLLWQGVGLDDPQRSLPTLTIL